MIFNTLNIDTESRGSAVCTLYLTCDKFGDQNKNNYLFLFLEWIVITGKKKRIEINILIPVYTKNICDGKFGLLKRCVRQENTEEFVSSNFMEMIRDISDGNTCVPYRDVAWKN